MKKFFQFLICCSLAACSKSIALDEQSIISKATENSSATSTSVSAMEAYHFAQINQPVTTRGEEVSLVSVDPVIGTNRDTLMYIVNYSDGWKILSSDKRTPAVLAYGEIGNISINTDNQQFLAWIDVMAEELFKVKQSADENLVFSKEQIQLNLRQWESPQRSGGDWPSDLDPDEWEYAGTQTGTDIINTIPHMITAMWHQDFPYNRFCPLTSYDNSIHTDVGCAAIAGGQILHYWYEKSGYPATFTANYPGGNNTVYSLSDLYATQSSDSLLTDVTARFLRTVGHNENMTYNGNSASNTFSYALPWNIDDMFSYFNFNCDGCNSLTDVGNFNSVLTQAENNLLNYKPVMILAFTDGSLIDHFEGSHYFVMDGIRQTAHYTSRIYVRKPDPNFIPTCPEDMIREYKTYYGGGYFVQFNWGWKNQTNQPYYYGWFEPMYDWVVDEDSNYNTWKTAYYNITPNNS